MAGLGVPPGKAVFPAPAGPSWAARAGRRIRSVLILAAVAAIALAALCVFVALRWSYSSNQTLGSRVVLTYDQHLGLPSCFAETEYWVSGVRAVPQ